MSQATQYHTTDDHDAPKTQYEEQGNEFRIVEEETMYHIRPEGGWNAQNTSGIQLCNAWQYDNDGEDEPVEKLLVLSADEADGQMHFSGYGVERFQRCPESDRYMRTFRSYETADDLADALDTYGFGVETEDAENNLLG